MTAEVVIMNRAAVAVAADSAVTVPLAGNESGSWGAKIFNTANKIFAVSRRDPVGLMVYGNQDFLAVPWETIAKLFRSELGARSYATVDEYTSALLELLTAHRDWFSEEQQRDSVEDRVGTFLSVLVSRAQEGAHVDMLHSAEAGEEIDQSVVADCYRARTAEVIEEYRAALSEAPSRAELAEDELRDIRERYGEIVAEGVDEFFDPIALPRETKDVAVSLALDALVTGSVAGCEAAVSGVVFVGYGHDEILPHLRELSVWGMAAGNLLYSRGRSIDIDHNTVAAVVPFAQRDMVYTFMEGVDPTYQRVMEGELAETLDRLIDAVAEAFEDMDEGARAALKTALEEVVSAQLEDYRQRLADFRREHQSDPITTVVESLPKHELAEMAEALVSLTSLKRMVSREQETVGGPIDVALISKGDGLVWVKRKHYFPAELNPGFFARYAQEGHDEAKCAQSTDNDP